MISPFTSQIEPYVEEITKNPKHVPINVLVEFIELCYSNVNVDGYDLTELIESLHICVNDNKPKDIISAAENRNGERTLYALLASLALMSRCKELDSSAMSNELMRSLSFAVDDLVDTLLWPCVDRRVASTNPSDGDEVVQERRNSAIAAILKNKSGILRSFTSIFVSWEKLLSRHVNLMRGSDTSLRRLLNSAFKTLTLDWRRQLAEVRDIVLVFTIG